MSLSFPKGVAVCFGLIGNLDFALAQGTVTALNTGGGQPLVSEVRSMFVDGSLVQPRLLFDFGFATEEIPVLGAFLDSFTVTIRDSNQLFSVVYLTADASGTVFAPPTPGALVINPATISTNAFDYPSLNPVLANQRAYAVSAPIPVEFIGQQINVHFDLFDNQNSSRSQGWFSNVKVPEPQAWTLLLLAGAFGWRFNRIRK